MCVIGVLFYIAKPIIAADRLNIIVTSVIDKKRHIVEHLIKALISSKAILITMNLCPESHSGNEVILAIYAVVVILLDVLSVLISESPY